MMLEEVHAVAPGAALAFCGPQTSTEYLSCLGQFAAGGATIMVDDLAFGDEDLLSSNSDFVQGVESFLSQNPKAQLFTVTENYNGSYWQGNYTPIALSSLGFGISSATCSANNQTDLYVNNFGAGATGGGGVETLTVYNDGTFLATFQWADPFGQNASNFDVYTLNDSTGEIVCLGLSNSSNTFFGPFVTLAAGTYSIVIATPDQSLAGKIPQALDWRRRAYGAVAVIARQHHFPSGLRSGRDHDRRRECGRWHRRYDRTVQRPRPGHAGVSIRYDDSRAHAGGARCGICGCGRHRLPGLADGRAVSRHLCSLAERCGGGSAHSFRFPEPDSGAGDERT